MDFSVKLRAAVVRGVSEIRIVIPTFFSRYFRRRVHKTHFTILPALFLRGMAINSTLLHCNTHNGRMVKWVSWEFRYFPSSFLLGVSVIEQKRLLLCSRRNQNCQHYYREWKSWYVRKRADFVHKECLMFTSEWGDFHSAFLGLFVVRWNKKRHKISYFRDESERMEAFSFLFSQVFFFCGAPHSWAQDYQH